MANGSCLAHGVGTVDLFPFISIDIVLYVPRSLFNLLSISRLTRSLDCTISFTQSFVCLQDWSSRQVIGTGCESHDLYHLHPSSHVGAVMESPPLLLPAQLGYPSLTKLQQLVPGFSKLSKLMCELCQLGKHSRSYFPHSIAHSASSPFALVHSHLGT